MKKKFILFFSITMTLLVSSCEKMVEVEPKNAISSNVALANIGGYEALLNSAYVRLIGFGYYGRNYAILGDVMADNIYTELSVANGRFIGQNANQVGVHQDIWGTAYSVINDVNTIIASIDGITDPRKDGVKAEALALRALVYFDLARVYGYEPTSVAAGKGFNLSVPLRLVPTGGLAEAQQFPRATVAEVYKSIEDDLKASLPLFGSGAAASRFRLNKGAAYALLGRTYLYEGKWAEAVTEFDNAMNVANTGARLATAGNYITAFKAAPNTESFFELVLTPATQLGGVTGSNESLYSYTHPSSYNGISTFGGQTASDELYALFETTDDRFKMFFKYGGNSATGTQFNWADKYSGARAPYADNIKVIRFSDVLLMKAEALAEQGQFVAAAALVVQLRTNRNASITGVPVTAALNSYIQDERRRELFFEGQRFFDLKRKALGITKPAKTGINTLAADDFRILAPIPNGEFLLGLVKNPGY
ncbi:MAG: RagB/SusD family nutrient uptake outer membrane protein [Pedobacter sp.]|nr:MAG: RagB/SusD family nutrient uptake outer membrane protein [Pedobacter sp.]